jgi:hypothetical protein
VMKNGCGESPPTTEPRTNCRSVFWWNAKDY